jgi:hypothetical protein
MANHGGYKTGERRINQGGARAGAGRPSREEAEFKDAVKAAVEKAVQDMATRIGAQYVKRALGKNGDRILMHIVDRVLPPARSEAEISGEVKIFRVVAPRYD